VEVEVDILTGKVKVLRIVAAHDVGLALNPMVVEGQIEGAVAQGLGYALMEKHSWDSSGQVVTTSFMKHKIPTSVDVPLVQPIIVETKDPIGPYGAKGVGEPALTASAAAIANAIYDAVGVRMTSLPMTPENIHEKLAERESSKRIHNDQKERSKIKTKEYGPKDV
jgi:xanthine dehydrogenase molybdenum-binding subunit